MSKLSTLRLAAATAALALAPLAAHAGATNVPEPGTWALVGLAAAVGLLISRKKRK